MPELEYFSIMFKSEFERSHPVHNGWLDVVWAKIVSFDRLKTLKTNFLPPDRVLMIPSLRTLHIDLQEFRNRREFHLVFDTMSEGSDSQVVPSVSNLIVDLNMSFFEERTPGSSHDEVCSQMMNFMEYLCDCRELKTVQLRLCYDDGDGIHHLPPLTRSEELLYNDLMPFFGRLNTVETLIIDSNDVDWDLYARNDGVNDKPYSLWTAKHQQPLFAGDEANELIDMSGLRRLVAPQEAFFSHVDPEALSDFHGNGYQFEPTLLPSSVESIEIIDSTRALNRWARYVLELPEEYPSLKIIVLWCDTHTDPFVDDDRIRPSGEPKRPDTIYYCFDGAKNVPETESDWRLEVDVSDKVWEEIEEAGISLVSTRSATADGARFREQHCYTIYPLMDAIK
ncbi:hypothetical protein BU23DRAFT_560679 [Bimuria novae-zelandiae CBS 107.79]|uniref:Uncharacterized protein n=1 Tax=Bimuria novae-zelandiae CBS 107.79 TaxID=1447943 RepID=A0A6A5UY32_9PLEO|nr:hypothetical protein BU23DRAFT_560679 [Bimuria novae-zelandiae CBS 107.79]